jgi:hypothetical protein
MDDLARIGGMDALRAHLAAFLDRAFDDMIIGFTFVGRDKERILRHEVEHAARTLGADVPYTGRPLGAVHRALRLNRGQFRRRLALLRTVLLERGVDADVVARWIAADAKLEDAMTDGSDCTP